MGPPILVILGYKAIAPLEQEIRYLPSNTYKHISPMIFSKPYLLIIDVNNPVAPEEQKLCSNPNIPR
jgi:hypothetical protein